MADDQIWAPDCKLSPYWLDDLDPVPVSGSADDGLGDLADDVDVAIIGSGYTGLSAALELARAGCTTLVLEAEEPGHGCSSRNGGQISTSIKPSLKKLTARLGAGPARALRKEGEAALEWIGDFVSREAIDCDFRQCGRFHAAHTPRHYENLTRDAETMSRDEGIEAYAVPRTEQRRELGSDYYYGGVVFPRHAALHPAKYHRGLLALARDAGARVVGQCRVTGMARDGTGFLVRSARGIVRARDVIVATNGYTTGLTPWLQRRVIPIGSYIIATEPVPRDLMARLFPTGRIVSDTCKVLCYYRPSPDGTRVLFGGRVCAMETDPTKSGPRLYAEMCRIFPELGAYRVSHSWMGRVAYTFDELAHTGTHDGVHYAMGYCGSGVSMASYLGMRLAQKILKQPAGATGFDAVSNPTRPFYTGKPWFLPAVVALYHQRDAFERRQAARSS